MTAESQPAAEPRVVLADDDEDFLPAVAAGLAGKGAAVKAVTRARDVLPSVADHRADVLVLDIRLPDQDGFQVLQEAKAKYPALEVIVLTAYAHAETAVKAMEAGAFDYLVKPIDLDELYFRVQDAWRGKALGKAPEGKTD